MKLFIYEFITGGGTWHTAGTIDPAGSLLAEGRAMVGAIVADLVAAGHTVAAMVDRRLLGQIELPCQAAVVASAAEELTAFDRLVSEAEGVILIAPEIGSLLLDRVRRLEEIGGQMLSPDSRFVAIGADKEATAQRLTQHGVRVPAGMHLRSANEPGVGQLLPAVIKPCDGAGSWLVRRVADIDDLGRVLAVPEYAAELARGNLRLERYVSGLAASVSVLSGPRGIVPLIPCQQLMTDGFEYLGGRLPLSPPLAERAQRLALATMAAMPTTVGYVGIDLGLGAADDGSEDTVIEINPRLTTSYVGLRAACRENLAAAMVEAACGGRPTLSWTGEKLEFRADGTLFSGRCTQA